MAAWEIEYSAPALEPQGRAWQVCGICTTSSGPNTGSNPGGGRVLNKQAMITLQEMAVFNSLYGS